MKAQEGRVSVNRCLKQPGWHSPKGHLKRIEPRPRHTNTHIHIQEDGRYREERRDYSRRRDQTEIHWQRTNGTRGINQLFWLNWFPLGGSKGARGSCTPTQAHDMHFDIISLVNIYYPWHLIVTLLLACWPYWLPNGI